MEFNGIHANVGNSRILRAPHLSTLPCHCHCTPPLVSFTVTKTSCLKMSSRENDDYQCLIYLLLHKTTQIRTADKGVPQNTQVVTRADAVLWLARYQLNPSMVGLGQSWAASLVLDIYRPFYFNNYEYTWSLVNEHVSRIRMNHAGR